MTNHNKNLLAVLDFVCNNSKLPKTQGELIYRHDSQTRFFGNDQEIKSIVDHLVTNEHIKKQTVDGNEEWILTFSGLDIIKSFIN